MHGKDNLMSNVKTLPFVIVFTVHLLHDFDLFFRVNYYKLTTVIVFYFMSIIFLVLYTKMITIYCFIIHKSAINKS